MIPGDDLVAAAFLTVRFAAFLVVVLATAVRDLAAAVFAPVTFFAAFLAPAFLAAPERFKVVLFEALVFEAFAANRDLALVRLLVLTIVSLSLKDV